MFLFRDIIGQTETQNKLLQEYAEGRVPHALLISGPEGSGKMALALAYARLLLCTSPNENDGCEACASCHKINKLIHPDLHFAFPIIKKDSKKDSVCDDYIKLWREFLLNEPYPSFEQWTNKLKAGNSQPIIYTKESDEIIRKLNLKSSEGGYKVMIIWLPEKMKEEGENKILKVLEEPPMKTLFILVSDNPEGILQTIKSRTQLIAVPPIEERDITQALEDKWALSDKDAKDVAHLSNGSMIKAISTITNNETNKQNFDLFVSLMRLAYMRNIKELKAWSEKVAGMGREKQKAFLEYTQRMVRENFMNNFQMKDLVYMNSFEKNFSVNFSPYINEYNAIGLMEELNKAQQHIIQNVNAKMVFFDFVLKIIVLLKH